MNASKNILLLVALWAALHVGVAEEPKDSSERRLDDIQSELKTRRERREDALMSAGVVCVPEFRPTEWYDMKHEIVLENTLVTVCAQLYATLAKKEVMVSGKVAKQRVNIPIQNLGVNEAIVVIRRALADAGVTIYQVDDDTVAWCAQAGWVATVRQRTL